MLFVQKKGAEMELAAQETMELSRRLGPKHDLNIAAVLGQVCEYRLDQGKSEEAESLAEKSYAIYQAQPDPRRAENVASARLLAMIEAP